MFSAALLLGNKGPSSLLDGLFAFYKLDGDGQDASGNGNHAIVTGGITFTSGYHGQAAVGVLNNAVNGPYLLGNVFSIAAWCKTSSQLSSWYGGVVAESSGEGLFLRGTGTFSFYSAGADHDTIGGWTANTWTHICVTYDGTNMKFYVNGIYNTIHTVTLSNSSFTVTNMLNAGNVYPAELVDDIGLWTRVLTAGEVAELAASTYPF